MNNKKSVDNIYKRLIPAADDSKRNYLSGHYQSFKKSHPDQLITSPVTQSNMSSYPSGRAIDAQTFVDAQSNGFTKRIVRYEEENKKVPKLFNRTYKRPGDFPIVHLDKPKLVLTPKRNIANPPKMARIGQPDPSINRTNIRAEILRNGTMMPPISVDRREDVDNVRVDPLDALKEISRKRIHCEDTVNQIQQPPGPAEKDSTDSVLSATIGNNSKRQRIASSINSSSANDSNKKGYSMCNEIRSSLSSSSYMLSPSSPSLKRTEASSPSNSLPLPQAKRLQIDKPIETPTIDPTVEIVETVAKPIENIVPEMKESAESTRPKLTLFNRPYATNAPVLPPVSNDRNDDCNIPFVKPRPMTSRSRESVENWLKIKPDEKRRLSLMLSCLSGEVDDSDTVDSKDTVNETPAASKPVDPIVAANDKVSLQVSSDKNATENNIFVTTVAPNAQIVISSTTTSLLPTKPAITFSTPSAPISNSTSISTPQTTTVQAESTVVERKGGFSFPLTKNDTSQAAPPSAEVTSTPAPAAVTFASTSSPTLATVTPTPASSSSSIIPKESIPTSTPTVTFTFHTPKPKAIDSPVVSNDEPAKTFSFGNVSNVTTPAFGSFTTTETAKQTTSGTVVEPKKPTSFAAFGQTSSIGNVDFGKSISSPAATSNTTAFGSTTPANAFDKAPPPTFGSMPTKQQTSTNDTPIQSNMTSTFSKNDQTPVFGSAFSNTTTTNTQTPFDPRTTNNATTTSFTANQLVNPTTTSAIGSTTSFAFGASTTAPSVFKTQQSTQSTTSSFGAKPDNSTANIFGSLAPQGGSAATPIFGSSANTNIFDQTPKTGSVKEAEKNVASQNIFGSSTAKPSPAFAFSANNQQPNANNIFGQTLPGSGTGGAFNFGGSNQKTDLSSTSNKSFTFNGSNNAETKPVAFASKSVAPAFGSSNVTDSVGFAANNQSTNSFNTKSTNDEVPKVFSFGGGSNTPSVGANGNVAAPFGRSSGMPSSFGVSSGSSSFGGAAPTFGSNTNANANATPVFGGNSISSSSTFAPPNVTPAFGGNNATPAFGGSNATPTFGGNNVAPSFGGNNVTPSFGGNNATPSFGGSNATSTFGGSNATSTFGGNNATPAFGGNNATPAFGGSNATSTFGGNNATPAFGGNNATPSFGGNNATSTFGGNNATPAFGGNNALPSFSGNSSFGGSNATPTFGSNNATSVFNANSPGFGTSLNSSSSSGFGGAPAFTTSTGTADVNKTFNFTGNDPAPSPVPNLFNIGPGSTAPKGRNIRTATRRTYR